ncbi:nuclear transport factor 2 family protein [Nocardia abscessus]|uniref:nuclear transport factor 2 family protein n=1 Tax=Nocardia abscessus TaxID=120957 RepID=UPI0002DABB5C|nr:nuclear transport factor 2 family protein [Nocardia abscessus]MCC3326696.1 nuclear transport factor 2 family protein [Nocardia abscessus]
MSAKFEVVKGFYRATQTGDGPAILALLHPDFEARTAPGMPCGAGGAFHGPLAAMTRIWGAVARDFETAPYDETWQETTDGTVVVTGHYRGAARGTGREYEAEFVHLWQVDDEGRITRLHQYTDTARWHAALTA